MLKFKHKILIAYFLIFLLILALILPFAQTTVKSIAKKAMEDRATELISRIQDAPNNEELVETLKMQKPLIFFRVGVISNEKKVLYDSHTKRVLGEEFSSEYILNHPEVNEAFAHGIGYHEEYSQILDQDFAYFAKAFNFHGKTYILRIAFPLQYVQKLSNDFEAGFIATGAFVLVLYSLLTWFVISYLTKPILSIIKAIKPYEEGELAALPMVREDTMKRTDEFGALGRTLNSLSNKIQLQINTLTEERNEKAQVLEALNEGVVAVDPLLHVTYANSAALKFLAQDPSLIHQSYVKANESKGFSLLQKCQQEDKILTDTIQLKQNGHKYFLDLVAAPKEDGAVLVFQDKTTQYKMMEMRKDFIANASHELKTPITIIRGFAEALHDNPDLSKESKEDITQRIVNSCERMTTLIQDLLTLADLERLPAARLQECNLEEIAQRAIDSVALIYKDAKIELHLTGSQTFPILADPGLIELAITNLVENGCKYSEKPAHVKILLEAKAGTAKLVISDSGMGIPEEDLPHIFERFYRVDKARTRKQGGSGLGLSIVQAIIEKHYGSISVQSEHGKGTEFTITLALH